MPSLPQQIELATTSVGKNPPIAIHYLFRLITMPQSMAMKMFWATVKIKWHEHKCPIYYKQKQQQWVQVRITPFPYLHIISTANFYLFQFNYRYITIHGPEDIVISDTIKWDRHNWPASSSQIDDNKLIIGLFLFPHNLLLINLHLHPSHTVTVP